MNVMAKVKIKPAVTNRLRHPIRRLLPFFHRLQWKLTLNYTLFTVATTLILAGLGLTLLWYLNFRSNLVPNLIADGLLKGASTLAPYLEKSPPDREGLNSWLQSVTPSNFLIINIPNEDTANESDTVPGQFGRVLFVAIVDPQGTVLAATPAEATAPDSALQLTRPSRSEIMISPDEITAPGLPLHPQLPDRAAEVFQAALQGETDASRLGERDTNGALISAVPIFGTNRQVLGAIYVKLAFPIDESEFLQETLSSFILPIVLGMVVSGGVAGVFFWASYFPWLDSPPASVGRGRR